MEQQFSRRGFVGLAGLALAFAGFGVSGVRPVLADGDTHEVTDPHGNTFELPNDIETAVIDQVPLASTYVMYKGGSAEGLIGLSGSVYQVIQQTLLPKIAPEILDVDTSYYENGELNVETLMTLHPDIVLYNSGNSKHKELFDQAGLNSFGFSTTDGGGNPAELYADWLRGLEQVYREPGKMDEVIDWGTQRIDMVKERTAELADDERKRVLILFNVAQGSPRVSGGDQGKGGNLFGHYWLKTIGAVNVADEVNAVDAVDMEQILAWDPDIIFLSGKGQSGARVEEVLANTVEGLDFSPLTAVKEGRVYSCDLGMWSWTTPNPDAPLVALWLATTVYPELFSDIDLEQETRDYYKLGYNYELTDEDLESIYEDSHIG